MNSNSLAKAGVASASAAARRLRPAQLMGCCLLAAVCVLMSLTALGSGALELPFSQVMAALFGKAPANVVLIVTQWRLPRVAMALILGAALGVAGAVFQSLTRNPLGSPDIIGFNTGAYSGALLMIMLTDGSQNYIALGAVAGGLLAGMTVYLLAWRQGIQGFRLIIVGIAISAMLSAANNWMIISASLASAMSAALWMAGSLNGITWHKGVPSIALIAIALVLMPVFNRRMQLLEMGDDAATALGVNTGQTRLALMVLGITLTAAVAAAAGPISFIALAAPQLARRLTQSAGVPLLASALMGAALLLCADVVAQHLFSPNQLPVGVVTISIGGLYLIWLLIRESRRL
ncbi:iron complex transport system permease protein [Biostraticola tofi]|uniref:Iron complex transport system permease protein n=2 Tax=Biostraticola tofi TaxID=466109 RepID=A0A4R3Z5E1_9GAMM|nr:iron-enterobactin ABC transporter permease [Biostraticola tofi]TCW00467.1 iron complex transport system permease protein [Biostraticola tofi]